MRGYGWAIELSSARGGWVRRRMLISEMASPVGRSLVGWPLLPRWKEPERVRKLPMLSGPEEARREAIKALLRLRRGSWRVG